MLLIQALLGIVIFFVQAYLMLMAAVLLFGFLIAAAYHSQVNVITTLPVASPYMLQAAIILSVGYVWSVYSENKKAYTLPGQKPPMAQNQRKKIILNKNADEAFSLCLDSLNTFEEGFRKINPDSQNLQIEAITKK